MPSGKKYTRGTDDANTLNAAGEFRVPDFRGRLGVGSNSILTGGLNENTSDGPGFIFSEPSKTRELGATGGSFLLRPHQHFIATNVGSGGGAGEHLYNQRTLSWSRSTVGGSSNDKYKLGGKSSDAIIGETSVPINPGDGFNQNIPNGANKGTITVTDAALTEQMPPFVSINYLIKT